MPKGKHANHARASRQHRWKPGGSVGSTGHVKIRVGVGHPLADRNGYAYEHLLVWVSAGYRRPLPGELLHHKNEDKTDNRLSNLDLMTRAAHNALHNAERKRCETSGRFVGKSHAGRLLDGVEHNAFPEGE